MKQKKRNETKEKSQSLLTNQDTLAGQFQPGSWFRANCAITPFSHTALPADRICSGIGEAFVYLSPRNAEGLVLAKGPPGRSRSPGLDSYLNPDNKTGPEAIINLFLNILQQLNKSIQQILHQLIFKIMKKQILFLAFFALAALASVSKSYGQAVAGSAPQATAGCIDDPLHPMAGKSYNYAAALGASQTGTFTWWATKDPNFVTAQGVNNMATTKLAVGAGKDITAASASYGVSSATGSVDITWSSTVLSSTGYKGLPAPKTPTFVVVQADGTGTTCADNLKVYELDPKNGFTVDILNINNVTKVPTLPYGTNESQCIDKVSKATYAAGAMTYLYGTNIFYYEIVAANFSDSWKPTLTLTGLNAVQTSVIEWTYDKTLAGGWTAYVPGTTTVLTNATDTHLGVSIYVRVTVTNNNYEGLTDKNIVLTVDGQNKDGAWDIKNSTCADVGAADGDDVATQVLKFRPTITPGTTSVTVPNTTIVPGNSVP